jgi:hypothetical protein
LIAAECIRKLLFGHRCLTSWWILFFSPHHLVTRRPISPPAFSLTFCAPSYTAHIKLVAQVRNDTMNYSPNSLFLASILALILNIGCGIGATSFWTSLSDLPWILLFSPHHLITSHLISPPTDMFFLTSYMP